MSFKIFHSTHRKVMPLFFYVVLAQLWLCRYALLAQTPSADSKPNLYIISIGIPSKGLRFTFQDAESIFEIFRTQEGHLFNTVKGQLLVCSDDTERTFMATALEKVAGMKFKKNDLVIFFLSGHGSVGSTGFGLVSSNALKGVSLNHALLNYRNEVLASIQALPCHKVILLDACHSGASASRPFDLSTIQQSIRSTPANIVTLSSSSDNEQSFESKTWMHGAFSRSIIDGLNGQADAAPKNGVITIRELTTFVVQSVPGMVNREMGRSQHPELANAIGGDFPIFNYLKKAVPAPLKDIPCAPYQSTTEASSEKIIAPKVSIKGKYPHFIIDPIYEDAEHFSEDLAAVKLNGSWGFIDLQGEMKIKNNFDQTGDFSEGLAAVAKSGRWGFVQPDGTIKIPCIYEDAGPYKEGLAPIKKGGLWGYINGNGKVVIPFKYPEAKPFSQGLAAVSLKIMSNGPYSSVPPDGQWGYVDKTGRMVIAPTFTDAESFEQGLAWVRNGSFGDDRPDTVDGFYYGYIDKSGKPVIPIQFPTVTAIGERWVGFGKEGNWGYMDVNGQLQLSLGKNIFGLKSFHEGLAAAKIGYQNWGYINTAGDVVIPNVYWEASDFSEGIAVVSTQIGTQRYFINKRGDKLTIRPPKKILPFRNGVAPAAIEDPESGELRWGYYKNPLRR